MKLNYRDKVLLTAVVVILVWVAGIMLFIKPAIDDIGTANNALDDAKATRSDLQAQVDADKDLEARIEDAYTEVTRISNNFYSYQETQEATQQVDTLLESDNIINEDMSISTYSTTILSPYVYAADIETTDMDLKVDEYASVGTDEEAADDTTTDVSTGEQVIGCYTISFQFTGTIDDVKNFCDKLTSNDQKTLVVSELSYKFVSEDNNETVSDTDITGSMSLRMIVLKKLSDPSIS